MSVAGGDGSRPVQRSPEHAPDVQVPVSLHAVPQYFDHVSRHGASDLGRGHGPRTAGLAREGGDPEGDEDQEREGSLSHRPTPRAGHRPRTVTGTRWIAVLR